ncbi:MAG: acyl-CoA dehydrogenase, partial [Aldersonia sp.]|nr:acyl-CoA dehydrogenase [Aldersonia sp.]
MFEWSEEDLMVRDALRGFIDKEVRPHIDELESGALPPYDIARKLLRTFGVDKMAQEALEK